MKMLANLMFNILKSTYKIFPLLAVVFFLDTSQFLSLYGYSNHNVPSTLSFILRQYLVSFAS